MMHGFSIKQINWFLLKQSKSHSRILNQASSSQRTIHRLSFNNIIINKIILMQIQFKFLSILARICYLPLTGVLFQGRMRICQYRQVDARFSIINCEAKKQITCAVFYAIGEAVRWDAVCTRLWLSPLFVASNYGQINKQEMTVIYLDCDRHFTMIHVRVKPIYNPNRNLRTMLNQVFTLKDIEELLIAFIHIRNELEI